MAQCPDILWTAEYIKNVLYFAIVRQDKVVKSTIDTHYFSIDNELLYENYYSDFGPLNLGCVYKYCKILNEKIKQYLNKQVIVHYTSVDPKKKANAAFLLGCYGVLYLSLPPKDALQPLLIHGQRYRSFQDATQGDSAYTISIMDCLQAIKIAHDLGFFNFQDFNFEEYDRLDKIQGGDLNWIIPGKFLAFIGPVDYNVSLYHPPEIYIDYFIENNVRMVIRLNKRMYDAKVFTNVGIIHHDLFFPDGSYPSRRILLQFLRYSEELTNGAIAVHCKAGLGRTGSLIGSYLIKHYGMTAHEAIGWMRICRPGSVIGHQQGWLEQIESWLIKQGNIYRKCNHGDTEKLPTHEFGVCSIAEKMRKLKPLNINKPPSSPPPIQRQVFAKVSNSVRPQASRVREALSKTAEREHYEWRVKTSKPNSKQTLQKGNGIHDRDADSSGVITRCGSGGGDLRTPRTPRNSSRSRVSNASRSSDSYYESKARPVVNPSLVPAFRTSQNPLIKTLDEAKNYLVRSSLHNEERQRLTKTPVVTVHPTYTFGVPKYKAEGSTSGNVGRITPSTISEVTRDVKQSSFRRRLGRSPSPIMQTPQVRPVHVEERHTRATNTPTQREKLARDASRTALREALSRLKVSSPRDNSVGAASLGARRAAPEPLPAPSVRSDERHLATQGDLLNSIKLQRRFRDNLHTDKSNTFFKVNKPRSSEKDAIRTTITNEMKGSNDLTPKEKISLKTVSSRTNGKGRVGANEYSSRDKSPGGTPRTALNNTSRPHSPKGRRNLTHNMYY